MNQQRNNYSAEFETKVALAALEGDININEIASVYGVHPNQVMSWKRQAVEIIPEREFDVRPQKVKLGNSFGSLTSRFNNGFFSHHV